MNELDTDDKKRAKKLSDLLARSQQGDREKFLKTFKEIKAFAYDADKSMEGAYKEWKLSDNAFKANISRFAEAVEIFGSHIYPQNPDASVVAQEEPDQWKAERFKLEERVLDYIMRVGELEKSARRAVNEAFLSGRGMLWIGWNERKKVPYAVFDTVDNFGIDPDAKCQEEVNFIWRKRTKPRFELKRSIPVDPETGQSTALFDVSELKGTKGNGDIIEYYEFYFRTGLHNYCPLGSDKTAESEGYAEYDDSPKKFALVEGRLLYVTEWEIPFHLIDAWPCRFYDIILPPEKLYPISPLANGLPHVKAMNWIYTTYLNRIKATTNMSFARVRHKGVQMGDAAVETALGIGEQGENGIFDIDMPSGMTDPDVRKLLQPLVTDTDMPGFEKAWGITNRALEDSIGLNDLIRTGQDANQLRTAADVEFKATRSLTRVDDWAKQFHLFFNDVVYSLAFTARYLMGPEDIARLFGDKAGALWGSVGDDTMKQSDEMERMQKANMAMEQAIGQSQQMMDQAIQMTGQVPTVPPPMPSPEEIETNLGPPLVVTMDDWIHSATREIVAGSMRPIDHEAQVSNLNFYFQSMAPVVQSTPPGQEMNAKMLELFMKLNRYDADAVAAASNYAQQMIAISQMQVQQMLAPPPPMPGPGANPAKPSPEPTQGKEQAAMGQQQ